jgi:hypothetical protein
MNTIGEILDINKAVCREFDVNELYQHVKSASDGCCPYSWSWGLNNPLIAVKNKALRFTVQGHHHKGYIYIVLNFMDTFDIYYTSNRNTIKKISNGVYIDVLIDVLDRGIERIPEYKH